MIYVSYLYCTMHKHYIVSCYVACRYVPLCVQLRATAQKHVHQEYQTSKHLWFPLRTKLSALISGPIRCSWPKYFTSWQVSIPLFMSICTFLVGFVHIPRTAKHHRTVICHFAFWIKSSAGPRKINSKWNGSNVKYIFTLFLVSLNVNSKLYIIYTHIYICVCAYTHTYICI